MYQVKQLAIKFNVTVSTLADARQLSAANKVKGAHALIIGPVYRAFMNRDDHGLDNRDRIKKG